MADCNCRGDPKIHLPSATVVVKDTQYVTEADYERLDNKPSIQGVELVGDRTLGELGITAANLGVTAESLGLTAEKLGISAEALGITPESLGMGTASNREILALFD